MAIVQERQGTTTRRLPIQPALRDLLEEAAASAGVEEVHVHSGGQPPYPGKPRTGSTRHDNGGAADLKLLVAGKRLRFSDQVADPRIEAFVEAAARLGATGIGAGLAYMGPESLHIGYGRSPQDKEKLVWGVDGRSANAPGWLRAAANAGWATASVAAFSSPGAAASSPSSPDAPASYTVIARDGLRLRGGPGLDFEKLMTIKAGTELVAISFAGPGHEWAKVDLDGDGLADGYVYAAFLAPAGDAVGQDP